MGVGQGVAEGSRFLITLGDTARLQERREQGATLSEGQVPDEESETGQFRAGGL